MPEHFDPADAMRADIARAVAHARTQTGLKTLAERADELEAAFVVMRERYAEWSWAFTREERSDGSVRFTGARGYSCTVTETGVDFVRGLTTPPAPK